MGRDSRQTKQKTPTIAKNAQGAPARRIAMFDPGNRHFRHADSGFFRKKQQLGIEHPPRLAAEREELPCGGGGDHFEPALRVRHRQAEDEALEKPIQPRREFAMSASADKRARDEPRSADDIRVSALDEMDHRRHDGKIRGEIRVREQKNVRVLEMPFP